MKRRIFSILTALALCLGLLPGTALAEETGAVTITGPAEDAQPVTLEAEKFYVINTSDDVGGVTVQETAPTDKAYLTYADRTLTVCGKEGNTAPIEIFGKMALSADLKMVFDSNAQASGRLILSWNGDSGPALALNGHTLTLEKDMPVTIQASEGNKPAVDGGTIRFAEKSNGNQIQLSSSAFDAADAGSAVSGNLAVENVRRVNISGAPPVFQGLDVKKCDEVWIYPNSNNATELSNTINRITIDRPIPLSVIGQYVQGVEPIKIQGLMMPDHTVWAEGGALTSGTHFIESDVTTPTAYRAGEGWALYTPGDNDTGTPAKLTLDGASYNGILNIQQADSVQLELKGENAVKSVNATAMTLTGNGSFQGKLETQDFMNSSTATLNAVVIVSVPRDGAGTAEFVGQTVYGNWSASDLHGGESIVQENAPITITSGATLTVPKRSSVAIADLESLTNHGTIVNQGEIKILSDSLGTPNLGTIVNDGTIVIEVAKDSSGEEIPAFIKALNLTGTGSGSVVTQYWDNDAQMSVTIATYTNSGLKLLEPAGTNGTLNLSSVNHADESHWNDQGYKWTDVQTDPNESTKITGAKLTLAPGFNAETVKLPETGTIEIVTLGEASIKTLSCEGNSPNTQLTLSGPGPLTITERINIAGGDNNSLTVEAGANVIANGGIYIGASGGVNSIVTVNGTLTSKGTGTSAVSAGSVAIGNTGVLNVSGAEGVQLNGMPKNTGAQYNNLFSVTGNGRFSADCSSYNIKVIATNTNDFPKDSEGNTDPRAVINLRADYWPENCEPRVSVSGQEINLWNTAKDDVYTGKMTIHQNHTYPSTWEKDTSEHWKECTYEGCGKRSQVGAHVYDGDWDATCNTCGYTRSVSHTHIFEGWQYDAGQHWKQCVCGERAQTGAHVFDGDQDLVCNTCGYNRGAAHTHGWATEWSHDETHHWHECTVAGCDVTSNSQKEGYGPHAYDNDQDTGCNICGYERTVAPSRPSGGGGGSSVSTYAVTVEKSEHGKVTSNRTNASSGSTVTLTVTPDPGYVLDTLTVTDSRDNTVAWQDKGDGKYTFTMPSRAVTVKSTFAPLPDDRLKPCDGGADCPSRGFTDLGTVGTWYHEAVDYVLRNNLMAGYGNGKFGPNDNLSRAQFVQILFNKEGRPVVNYLLRYRDVADGAWYTEAVRWATSQGIVHGYGNGMFGPNDNITREQLAVMLWRYSGSPAATDTELNFTDADKASGYAREALRWAVENGIIRGYGNGLLAPQGLATRAQAAQMLMNLLVTSTAVPFGQYAPRTARAA